MTHEQIAAKKGRIHEPRAATMNTDAIERLRHLVADVPDNLATHIHMSIRNGKDIIERITALEAAASAPFIEILTDHRADCCPALALWLLGQHDMARTEAALCEWGQLQRLCDDDDHGPLFSGASRQGLLDT